MKKLKFQPSIYVARESDESPQDFIGRVLKDPRLLPDQRETLAHDSPGFLDRLIKGIWIEQAPLTVETEAKS